MGEKKNTDSVDFFASPPSRDILSRYGKGISGKERFVARKGNFEAPSTNIESSSANCEPA